MSNPDRRTRRCLFLIGYNPRLMRAIIIGAGRGRRLEALTQQQPKCYVPIGGRPILDWTLEAFNQSGLGDGATVFVGGYRIDLIRRDYPHLTFCHNAQWAVNNILASLFHAEPHMGDGFVCAYSDILFRDTVVRRALAHPGDVVLCVDTHWRDRYASRTQHPEDDAEKVITDADRVVRIHRGIDPERASGEFIGVVKFTEDGAACLGQHYQRVRRSHAGKPWRAAKSFERAYLIDLLQDMIEQGVPIHMVTTQGDYMEIDTEEDYEQANRLWPRKVSAAPDG